MGCEGTLLPWLHWSSLRLPELRGFLSLMRLGVGGVGVMPTTQWNTAFAACSAEEK